MTHFIYDLRGSIILETLANRLLCSDFLSKNYGGPEWATYMIGNF